MKLQRNDAGARWIATQGLWYGLGATRVAAVLDCIWTCIDALFYSMAHPWRGRWRELRGWVGEVFCVGDE